MNYNIQVMRWYINRLNTMSLKEIIIMRLWRCLRDSFYRPGHNAPAGVILEIKPFSDEYRQYFLKYFSHCKEEILKKADRLLENKIEIFGKEFAFDGNTIDWNMDYIHCKKWPLKQYTHSLSSIADPKYIWEINRHQFLTILGKAFFFTQDEKYAKKAISYIESWIEQNPPFTGINWYNAIEPALRQISWLWLLKYLASSKQLDNKAKEKISKSLFIHTSFIYQNLSLYSSANNHLIAELSAIVMAGIQLGVKKWGKTAVKMLNDQINNQILEDGVGAEQSLSYQLYTMEYYLIAMLYLKGQPALTDNVLKRLEKAALFIKAMVDTKGFYPAIGDDDSGTVLKLSNSYNNSKTILNLTAYATGNLKLLQNDVKDDEKLFWLIGPDDFKNLIQQNSLNENDPAKTQIFKNGGYCIFKKESGGRHLKMIFDFGPLGLPPLFGHGHADALSFILYIDEQPIFTDRGTYSYYRADFWRQYFRGTAAHNTIRIDGVDQSVFSGRFLASYAAKSELLDVKDESVSAKHLGYARLKAPAVHTRTVSFKNENTIIITDKLDCKGGHLIEQFFHLGPDCKVEESTDNNFKISFPKESIILEIDPCLQAMIYYGDEVLPLGWSSAGYGSKEKHFCIVGRTKTQEQKNKELVTRMIF